MFDLNGKKILVIGLARTGVATSLFCARHEAIVTAVDTRPESELAEIAAKLRDAKISLQLGGYTELQYSQNATIVTIGARADHLPGETAATVDPRLNVATKIGSWTARLAAGLFHQGRWRGAQERPKTSVSS